MATNSELDEKFIAQQRDRLERLKEELLRIRSGMAADDSTGAR